MKASILNRPEGYGWISIALHWLSFVLVAIIFGLGLYMVELTYYDALYNVLPQWHKALGLVLLVFISLRLLWLFFSNPPAPIAENPLVKFLIKAAHWSMYVFLLLLIMTGYVITTADGADLILFNWITLPSIVELESAQAELLGDVHEWLAYGLAAMVAFHAAAALVHHFVMKDATLKRMIKP